MSLVIVIEQLEVFITLFLDTRLSYLLYKLVLGFNDLGGPNNRKFQQKLIDYITTGVVLVVWPYLMVHLDLIDLHSEKEFKYQTS